MQVGNAYKIEDFLAQTIIPGFKPLINQNMFSTLYDLTGKILMTTNKVAKNFGFEDWSEMIGLRFEDLALWIPIAKKPKVSDPEITRQGLDLLKKLGQIQQIVCLMKRPVNLIIITPFQKIFSPFVLVQYLPVFNPHGEIIAIQGISTDYQMFGLTDYFKLITFKKGNVKEKIIYDQEIQKLKLTERQHQILFLVSHEISQRIIGQILGVKRGNIAKTISTVLCPKFNIIGSNSKQLLEKAHALNIHKFVPLSLCKPMLVILDDEVNVKHQKLFPES